MSYSAKMVAMVTIYVVRLMAKVKKNVSPSPMFSIVITESQIWYEYVHGGLRFLPSHLPFTLYVANMQPLLLPWH